MSAETTQPDATPINADAARCIEVAELMERYPVIRQLIGERDAALAELAQLKAAQPAQP